jgi:hypothetical protein
MRCGQILSKDPEKFDEAWNLLYPVLKSHDFGHHVEAVLAAADLFRRNERIDDEIATLKRGLGYHPGDKKLIKALEDAEKRSREPKKASTPENP